MIRTNSLKSSETRLAVVDGLAAAAKTSETYIVRRLLLRAASRLLESELWPESTRVDSSQSESKIS